MVDAVIAASQHRLKKSRLRGRGFMNKSSELYKVYLEKSEAAPGGVHSTQPEGRAGLPPAEAVSEAQVEKGVAVRCAKEQTGENRYPINQHEQEHHTHGPNN